MFVGFLKKSQYQNNKTSEGKSYEKNMEKMLQPDRCGWYGICACGLFFRNRCSLPQIQKKKRKLQQTFPLWTVEDSDDASEGLSVAAAEEASATLSADAAAFSTAAATEFSTAGAAAFSTEEAPETAATAATDGAQTTAESIDYLVLVNKIHPLPEGWEDALETVHTTNSLGDDVEVEKKTYDAYLLLKEDLEKEDQMQLCLLEGL